MLPSHVHALRGCLDPLSGACGRRGGFLAACSLQETLVVAAWLAAPFVCLLLWLRCLRSKKVQELLDCTNSVSGPHSARQSSPC